MLSNSRSLLMLGNSDCCSGKVHVESMIFFFSFYSQICGTVKVSTACFSCIFPMICPLIFESNKIQYARALNQKCVLFFLNFNLYCLMLTECLKKQKFPLKKIFFLSTNFSPLLMCCIAYQIYREISFEHTNHHVAFLCDCISTSLP